MTPIERVRRNRDMLDLSRRMARPKGKAAPFPRNSSSLAIFLLLVMFLVVKAALEPSVENILGYGLVFSAYGMGFLSVHYGLRHKAIYDANVVARRHKLPFNLIGAAVVGAASSSLVWLQDGSFLQGLVVLPVVTLHDRAIRGSCSDSLASTCTNCITGSAGMILLLVWPRF